MVWLTAVAAVVWLFYEQASGLRWWGWRGARSPDRRQQHHRKEVTSNSSSP
jgi:hypothetical protein